MSNLSIRGKGYGLHPAYYDAVHHAITKDLAGKEGTLLHLMPLLMLTESQSERFYWIELQKMISAAMYLNGKRVDLNINLIRPYPNRMFVALTENKNISGVYIPIEAGTHELRVEWHFDLENQSYERITHTQTIVIEPDSNDIDTLTIYSVPEASYEYSHHSPASLKTYAGSSLIVGKPRADVFNTQVTREGHHVMVNETVTLNYSLDLSNAAFFTPLLHSLNKRSSL